MCLLFVDETGAEGPSESDVYELVIKDVNVQDEGTFTCSVSGAHAINQNYLLTVNSKCTIHRPRLSLVFRIWFPGRNVFESRVYCQFISRLVSVSIHRNQYANKILEY